MALEGLDTLPMISFSQYDNSVKFNIRMFVKPIQMRNYLTSLLKCLPITMR
jgi:hypothetical protein